MQHQLVPLNESHIPADRISNWMLWNKTSILHEELNFTCRWLEFPRARNSNETEQFCAPQKSSESGLVDSSIENGHDRDCDRLTDLWNHATSDQKSGVYVEVGAGIGKCLLHMLIHTNAYIVALEAQPDRLFALSSTLMRMKNVYRNRVSLYLHRGVNNTVPIHPDQDLAASNLLKKENFLQRGATLDAYMEPLDFITRDQALPHIALLKLNMPGHTCHVLDGVTLERTRILSLGVDTTATHQNRHCSLSSLQTKLNDVNFKKENVNGSIFYRREPKIPHRLVFTFQENILKTKAPKVFYDNVQNTIRRYREAWGEPNAPVWFLTDKECRNAIQRANSTLLPYFDFEFAGKYKADICRVVALYLKGGYYFDVDLEVIQPLMLSSKTSFSTVLADDNNIGGQFFQAFMASEPKSPVLAESFADMIFWYEYPERRDAIYQNMGPKTLMNAFNRVPTAKRGQVRLLQETNPNATSFPSVARRKGEGCCCNFIVHDPMDGEAYFYSRILGAGPFCWLPPEENTREAQ